MLTISFLCGGFSLVLRQFGGIILGLSAQSIGLVYLPGTVLLAGEPVGWAPGRRIHRSPGVDHRSAGAGRSGLVMAITASPTMALWVLVLATWLLNLGADLASTPASDTVLADAAPNKAGSVAAMRSTFGTTGYARGPTVYIALFNVFFHRCWPADVHSRGLSAQQAKHAVDAVRSSLAHSPGVQIRPQPRPAGLGTDAGLGLHQRRSAHHAGCQPRALGRSDLDLLCHTAPVLTGLLVGVPEADCDQRARVRDYLGLPARRGRAQGLDCGGRVRHGAGRLDRHRTGIRLTRNNDRGGGRTCGDRRC